MRRLVSLLLLSTGPLFAHECWLQPSSFAPAPGAPFSLGIRVGMDFTGEPRPFTRERVVRLLHASAAGRADWTERLPATATDPVDLQLQLDAPGTHVLAYDSTASLIKLDAEKFHEYLREDGMAYIIALREQAGQATAPGRERYRRCAKAILQCGPAGDATWSWHTGQRIELVPLADPAAVRPGAKLRFLALFDQQPLAGALVQAWHRAEGHTTQLQAHAAADGVVEFTLPAAGAWMISTVRMVPASDHGEADWESFWANLTFSVQP